MPTRKKPATYQDIVDLPEWELGQIVNGELFATRTPAIHTFTTSLLKMSLGKDGRRPNDWWILFRLEFHFGPDVVVPDLCGFRRTSEHKLPEPSELFCTHAPDWVCEVLTPESAILDRAYKLPIYAREHVQHAWIVDPLLRTIEVFRRDPNGLWTLLGVHAGSGRIRAEPFEEIEVDLTDVFGPIKDSEPAEEPKPTR